MGSGSNASKVFGIVSLSILSTTTLPVDYSIAYTKKNGAWKYILDFSKFNYSLAELSGLNMAIVDGAGIITPDITFNVEDDAIGTVDIANQNFSETPRQKLAVKDLATSVIYIDNLPNPSIFEPEPTVRVKL